MRRPVILSGSSHPQLTQQICDRLGIEPAKSRLSKFSNNETSVELFASVREQDVFIVQSGCGHVNDNFIELLIMIQACKTASARKVTAVIPFFPYSRQPDAPFKRSGTRQATVKNNSNNNNNNNCQQNMNGNINNDGYKQWVVRSGTLIAELLTCAGADHIITMDLHDPQFQGFFDCPVDNLSSLPSMAKYIHFNIPDYKEAVIVSPDAGGAKRATSIAEKLHMDFALIHKERRRPDKSQKHDLMLVGDVRNKVCILIDDIADTSFTITKAAKLLHENGAVKIYALITHAILSGDAIDRIHSSHLDHVIVSDSVPQDEHVKKCSKIQILPVAPLFAEAIRRIHFGESVSVLFDPSYEIS
ncbi:phosphoribosyl pyrophosphokinase [Rhizopus microsporus var. microsporus]|uniref:ribose-phosphate diphosphokinase n=2 Tax=Rhizopus microsporus TaxID=58291 RepID=A0A2G4T7J9_RHIZD|nr:phosphoribosyl pyrophosphokinase [Rhizopus microsporus ATCC 52813]ORE08538.1 phosphoribosyl pyrophosphokinase [Rhizopus microsporus var. microsporus]PHZ16993.1 phosphoribosyl pyrophosphokinase [Rhizopus microsporus ATCC 52813]